MKIVLDTNVLVSGLINANGFPGKIVDLVQNNILQLTVDSRMMEEYLDVLNRDKFKSYFSNYDIEIFLDFIAHTSCHSISSIIISDLPDKGDIPFLEIALTENVILITGNTKHFPNELCQGCTILTPKIFCENIAENSASV
ncbi:MAG: putative toxin-antitoxin system toxin component, PIN family [Spirochaetia bacterium]|jgi:putative PIN family toxin of toxin-antitoxin system|nr:putative toxin-antitoxin system toxin component, PIN family [Spirochaetia bacterium]